MKRMKCLVRLMTAGNGVTGLMPVYQTREAAAADCATPVSVTIKAHEAVKVPLYISFDIPKGYCVKMYPRSSLLFRHKLMQPVSIVDSDYKGMVSMPLLNVSDKDVTLEAGERICQIVLEKVIMSSSWEHIQADRDQNGFGGTGRI